MPSMPPRPCTQPRCKNMATKHGRCDDHQPEPWVSNKGKSRHERGYGSKWVKVRGQALKRDGYLCQVCLRDGILTNATEVDHILNKAKGGTDALSNLQSICTKCHKAKTQAEKHG